MIDRLLQHIKSLLPDNPICRADILPFIRYCSVKKGDLLLKENEPCDSIYFVGKGILYLFYEQDYTRQVIHFALENWWITDYKTFATGSPAFYSIAAMEDSELIVMSREQYEGLLNKFPATALYFNKIHERAYGAALLKQKTYATVSKVDFYRYFKNTYPDILSRIPDPIFASYMQVSVHELQEIREGFIS